MSKCEDIQNELDAFLSDEIDERQKTLICDHLQDCKNCSQALRRLTNLSGVLDNWQALEPSPLMYEKLKARMKARKSFGNPLVRKIAFK
ncbi:MAG: zf-HC2 domain-containing protein, partial [Candidatus Brocadiia bacterium]